MSNVFEKEKEYSYTSAESFDLSMYCGLMDPHTYVGRDRLSSC